MGKKEKILQTLRSLKPGLAAQYHVKTIGLFGSAVRDEQRPESDIDILVEFHNPIGLFKYLELEEFLSEKLGARVDLVLKKALKPGIGRFVIREAVMA